MSTQTEEKPQEQPRGERSARGGRGGRGQDRREGGRQPGEERPQGERKPQEDRRDAKTGEGKPREKRTDREPREGKDDERKPREDRKPRAEGEERERKPRAEGEERERKPRAEYEERERRPRAEGEERDRRPRAEGEERERKPRAEGEERERRPRAEGEERERRPKRERKQREFDPDWRKKIEVTIETEIPPMPKEIIPKPNNEAHTQNLTECDRKVKEYEAEIEKLKKKRQDWRDQQKVQREKDRSDRLLNKESKDKEREGNKHLFEDHNALKKEVERISKEKKEVEEKLSAVQSKMTDLEKQFLTKSAMSLQDVKSQIEILQHRQMNEKMTGLEEKKLITDLNVLQKSIPVAEQYSKLLDEVKKIRAERKIVVEKLNPKFNQKKELGNEIKVIIDKRKAEEEANPNAFKKDKDEKGEKKEGEREKPKNDDPFSKKIEEFIDFKKQMFKKKDKLRKDLDEQWDKYHDQRQEIMKLEFMAKEKDYLKRVEEIKEKKAKELRQQLIDEYLVQNTPKEDATFEFRDEIAACDLLSSYLTSILPANKRFFALEKLDDDIKIDTEELKAKMKEDKKMAGLKLTPLAKKEEITYGGSKKKKGGKKQKPTDAKEEQKDEPAQDEFDPETKVVFDIQIRNAFSQIKMEPPVFNKDVEESILAVEKKKGELEKQVETKAAEIADLRKNAEESVPSLAELKERFKDAPLKERGDKGTHGRDGRKGTRGGRGGNRDRGENTQWHGNQERHPPREGQQEKPADAEELYNQEDSFEAQNTKVEKAKHAPRRGKISENDFPKL